MAHDHHHHHHHPAPELNSADHNRAFIIGISLNALFVIVEVVAGIWNNSMSLLTDAGHNLSDVASLVLSLIAFRLAKKKSTEKFTYGYKKTTVLGCIIQCRTSLNCHRDFRIRIGTSVVQPCNSKRKYYCLGCRCRYFCKCYFGAHVF